MLNLTQIFLCRKQKKEIKLQNHISESYKREIRFIGNKTSCVACNTGAYVKAFTFNQTPWTLLACTMHIIQWRRKNAVKGEMEKYKMHLILFHTLWIYQGSFGLLQSISMWPCTINFWKNSVVLNILR